MRVLLVVIAGVFMLSGCDNGGGNDFSPRTGGDAQRGHRLVEQMRCGSCHVIPEVDDAEGTVGPSLAGFADRTYIAGQVPNKPENLIRWLMGAPDMVPHTAMPDFSMDRQQAADIAAWLYTLR